MIVRACEEGATLNNAGNCRQADRIWTEITLNGTNAQFELDPSVYAPTFLAFFGVVSSFYFAGMAIRTILRIIR